MQGLFYQVITFLQSDGSVQGKKIKNMIIEDVESSNILPYKFDVIRRNEQQKIILIRYRERLVRQKQRLQEQKKQIQEEREQNLKQIRQRQDLARQKQEIQEIQREKVIGDDLIRTRQLEEQRRQTMREYENLKQERKIIMNNGYMRMGKQNLIREWTDKQGLQERKCQQQQQWEQEYDEMSQEQV